MVGYGNTCDAHHMTAPHPEAEGAARAIRLALEEAGMSRKTPSSTSTPTAPAPRSTTRPKRWPSRRRWARKSPRGHGQLHQVHDRPYAGRGGRGGGHRLRAGPAERRDPADHPLSRSRTRTATSTMCRTSAAGAGWTMRSPTHLGFGGHNAVSRCRGARVWRKPHLNAKGSGNSQQNACKENGLRTSEIARGCENLR